MIVRCGQCGTEFGLDERQIGPEGMPVRCSVCKNVFRVEVAPPKPMPWQVETTDGTRFTAATLSTLREWIEEGRLHPDDKVSRTGNKWVRLGDMPEFASAFEGFVDLPPVVKQVKPVRVEVGSSVRPIARGPEPVIPPISRRPDPMPPTPVRGTTNPELEVDDEPTSVRQAVRPSAAPVVAPAPASVPSVASVVVAPAPVIAPAPAPAPVAPTPAPARGSVGDDDRTMAMARPVAMAVPVVERSSTRDELPEPTRTPVQRPSSDEVDDFEVAPRRRAIGPGLIVFLAAIAGLGVVFGVPSIREKVLGGTAEPDAPVAEPATPAKPPVAVPELAEAGAAVDGLGLAALAKAEAALQPKLGEDLDADTSTRLKVALAELRLTRALAYEVAAALDEAQRETYRERALGDRNAGERLVDGLEGAPEVEGLAEVRALARLAAGRDIVEVQAMVPAGARELELLLQASPLWRDVEAKVPEGLVAGLSDLSAPSGLSEGVLALALVRANDETAARNLLERLLVRADDSIIGKALQVRLGDAAPDAGADTAGADTGDVAKAPPGPDAGVVPEPAAGGSGGGGGEGGMTRFDKLVESGCAKVHGGSADEGIDILLKAFDDRPNDLDVLVCLADGYGKQGNNGRAADFYDRALKQSPKFKPALIGAARVAAKTSATTRATKLYETLLLVDPDNAEAKEYLAKQGGEPKPEPAPQPSPSETPTPPPSG